MSSFDKALPILLKHEGGYVDNPADRGKATNFGITQTLLDEVLQKRGLPSYTVKHLTPAVVEQIYKENFWDYLQLGAIYDQKLATVCLDLSALLGVHGLTKIIQSICHVPPDGFMGPQTAFEFQQKERLDARDLTLAILSRAWRHLEKVSEEPDQEQFKEGWENRLDELTELLDT